MTDEEYIRIQCKIELDKNSLYNNNPKGVLIGLAILFAILGVVILVGLIKNSIG